MARYAATLLEWTGVLGVPVGAALTVQLGDNPLRFEAGPEDTEVGSTVYFTQTYVQQLGRPDIGSANARHLEEVLRTYLSVSRYEVVCTYYPRQDADPENPDITPQPHTLRLTITARGLGSEYDFPPVTLSGPFPPHTQRHVTAVAGPTLTVDFPEFLCFGIRNGRIEAAMQGGVPPYSYQWNDGASISSLRDNLGPGRYELTARDSAGPDPNDYDNTYDIVPGVVTRTIVITENSRLNVLVRKEDTTVTLQVSGGVFPYRYLWDDGPTSATREGLASGTYYCVVTDALGCQAETIAVRIDSFNCYLSRNPVTLSLDAGDAYRADPSTKPSLTFVCDVYIEPEYMSGDFVQVGASLEQPADRLGRTTFQVEELLDAFLDYHVPEVGQQLISQASPLFRRFYLAHAEVYGTPPERSAATTLTQHYILLGGLSNYEGEIQTYFSQYRPTVRPFLTWQPVVKEVYADQPEFLYYQSDVAAVTNIAVRCRVYFHDSTIRMLPLGQLFPDVLRYEVCCVPVGFAQLGLVDEATRHVVAWQVWIGDDADGVYSEVRTYMLNRLPTPQRRYFLYANSLGGMDTWCATGEAQFDVEVSGEEVERVAGPRYDVLRGDQLVLDRSLRPVLKVASGVRSNSRELMASWQDLVLSRRVLLLDGPRWLPGVFKTKTVNIHKEGEWVQTLELEFYLPRERNYTPRLPLVATQVTRQDLLLP